MKRLILLLFLAATSALHAQEPRFLIERIEVRGVNRVRPDIIAAETRIRTGQSYSEADFREASDRVRRLPFVLDANFALEKGSVRDAYVLAVSVTETKPFFYLLDAAYLRSEDENIEFAADNAAVVGLRFFVGRRGAWHVGMFGRDDDRPFTTDFSALQAGYTQYDILGTRAFATVAVNHHLVDAGGGLSPELLVGIPLSPRQTLTARYSSLALKTERRRTERVVDMRWSYNTTNHPFFPTRGLLLSAGPVAAWTDANDVLDFAPGPGVPLVRIPVHERAYGVEMRAAKYWELAPRNSVAVGLDGGWTRVQRDSGGAVFSNNISYGTATVRFSRMLTDPAKMADSEKRLELTLRARDQQRETLRLFADDNYQEVAVHWVRRDAWGALRLGLGYEW